MSYLSNKILAEAPLQDLVNVKAENVSATVEKYLLKVSVVGAIISRVMMILKLVGEYFMIFT